MALLFPSEVKAYIDPGSGSYFVQIVIAIFLSSLFFIKSYLRKIILIFKRLLRKDLDKGDG